MEIIVGWKKCVKFGSDSTVLIFDTGGDGEQGSQGPKGESGPQAEFGPQGPEGPNKNSWRFTF